MTDARATQVTIEEWAQGTPQASVTQIAVEQWSSVQAAPVQAAVTQIALEQWAVVRAPIELAGNLGGVSSYGKLAYGLKLYSRVRAFEPILSAALTVSIGRAFSGDLAPIVLFGSSLGIVAGVSGDFVPTISFNADLGVFRLQNFVGDLAPQIGLGAALSVDLWFTALAGGLTPNIALAASNLISGPLWTASPCPAPPWASSDPCPPSLWTPTDPCDLAEWNASELCNG
jgi:hypothetical protein